MRLQLGIVAAVSSLMFGGSVLASAGDQPMFGEQFVDLTASASQVSLVELASQVNPGRDEASQPMRSYTNADLKFRPAPILPVTPPFPEIAPPTGILEHQADPDIEPAEPAPGAQQFGIPFWDGAIVPFGFTPPRRPSRGSRDRSGLLPPLPEPPSIFRKPAVDLFSVDRGFRSANGFSSGFKMGSRNSGPDHQGSPRGTSHQPSSRGARPASKGRSPR